MSARNSGSHLVIELSSESIFQLLHQFLISKDGLDFACGLWPTSALTFQLINLNGDATVRATKADGTQVDYSINLTLNLALALNTGQTIEGYLNDLLIDFLPENVTVSEVTFRVVGGGSALAIGLFFQSSLQQNEQQFAGFSTDFLQGHDFGVAASVELLDRFVLRRAETQAMLRNMLGSSYTPADPNNLASLSTIPPGLLRLDGRGEFQTEDCGGVDADWWVFIRPFFQNGVLKARATYDYDIDWEDGVQVILCFAGNVLLGAGIGFLVGGFIGAIVGGVVNAPTLGSSPTLSNCGDQCYEVTVPNPARSDGKYIYDLDSRQSVEVNAIAVDVTGITVFGDASLSVRMTELRIKDVRSLIYPTAESACSGGAGAYCAASFTLVNPHPLNDTYERPQICDIMLSANLNPYAEVVIIPRDVPWEENLSPDKPFQVVREQRVEVRIKPGARPGAAITGSAVIRTNTPPTTRHVRVEVVNPGVGQIEIDPPELAFEQRDTEVIDYSNLRRRQRCEEPGPMVPHWYSIGGSLKIKNTGNGPLHVCDLVLDDPASVFQINFPSAQRFTILPDNATNVQIVLKPNANPNQQYTATVSVMSTDPNTPQIDVTVQATALTRPKGVNVGGPIAMVDNFMNVVCLEVHRVPGEGPPVIDLEKWMEIFTNPVPGLPGAIPIYRVALRDVTGRPSLIVQDNNGIIVKATLGPGDDRLSVTLSEEQLKMAEIDALADDESIHIRMSSYQLVPLSEYRSRKPIHDIWASGDVAALASQEGLEVVTLKDPANPKRLFFDSDHRLARLSGTKEVLYGLSERGLQLFSVAPEFNHRSSVQVEAAVDLAVGEGELVYVLTDRGLSIVDVADESRPTILREHELDTLYNRMIVVRSGLYLIGDRYLAVFSLSRPWLPEMTDRIRVSGVDTMFHWGTHIATHGAEGTRLFQRSPDGRLIRVADYPRGHWANGLVSDRSHRYIFSPLPDATGFTLWLARRRLARALPIDVQPDD